MAAAKSEQNPVGQNPVDTQDCRPCRVPMSKSAEVRTPRVECLLALHFQVFDTFDFLAEVTQHIPDKGEHLVRYFGWYSYRRRGIRAKDAPSGQTKIDRQLVCEARFSANGQSGRTGSTWAALVKRVLEVDPLECPKCGSRMKIISFMERGQREVVERSSGIAVCGRVRCEHWPRPELHQHWRTQIENRLSPANSSWYSIWSFYSDHP